MVYGSRLGRITTTASGAITLRTLAALVLRHAGGGRGVDLLAKLCRELPDAVDKYTPQGRLPSEADFSRSKAPNGVFAMATKANFTAEEWGRVLSSPMVAGKPRPTASTFRSPQGSSQPVQTIGQTLSKPILGGLHYQYIRA
jgi:hypothetical protein